MITNVEIRKSVLVMGALKSQLRSEMISFIKSGIEVHLIDIQIKFYISRFKALQNLAILKKAELILEDEDSSPFEYRINPDKVENLEKAISLIAD